MYTEEAVPEWMEESLGNSVQGGHCTLMIHFDGHDRLMEMERKGKGGKKNNVAPDYPETLRSYLIELRTHRRQATNPKR